MKTNIKNRSVKTNILDRTWTISIGNQCAPGLNGNLGSCNFDAKEIIITNSLANKEIEEDITHELTHAVIIQLMLNKESFTHEEVAEFCEHYTSFLYEKTKEIMQLFIKKGGE